MKKQQKLAKLLVNYSCKLQKGEKVLIEADVQSKKLVLEIIKQVYSVGAYPVVRLKDDIIKKEILQNADKKLSKMYAKYMLPVMQDMDAYIGISAHDNMFECSGIPHKNIEDFTIYYSKPVHADCRVKSTKWVILNYPTKSFAQSAKMPSKEFEEFYYKVCTLDYSKMNIAMNSLKDLMEKTDKVHIVGNGTDLTFSIKNMPAIKCAGEMNIPDGEVFTAPIKNSVNGIVKFNTASMYNGYKFDNIELTFKNGKIIKATSQINQEKLLDILNTDEGAKYLGEFAIGVNPYILNPLEDILFDEKICGSVHLTPGACYDEAPNGNNSAIHYDMVLIQRKEFGGGDIYFDDKLIRRDGIFVLDELKCLNPENLKD